MLKKKQIIDFLPYDSDVIITDNNLKKRILLFVLSTLKEIIETLDDFYFKEDLIAFDAHVGENLCQIRACQLLDIYIKTKKNPTIKIKKLIKIEKINVIIKSLEHCIKNNSLDFSDNAATVGSYIDKLQLNISISHRLYFLTLCHFLTKFRQFNELENTVIDYPKLVSCLKLSKNMSRRIIHQYQKKVSIYSYLYVKRKCSMYNVFDISLLELLHHIDDDGRYTLPCYIVMTILLADLYAKKINILFVIRNEYSLELTALLYLYDHDINNYLFTKKPTEDDLKEPCFVVHGISTDVSYIDKLKYIHDFNVIGFAEIIMASMAIHPQYSGKKLASLKDNPFIPVVASGNTALSTLALVIEEQFLMKKELGKQVGCSSQNARLIHIRHIFCDYLAHQLQNVELGHFYSTSEDKSLLKKLP